MAHYDAAYENDGKNDSQNKPKVGGNKDTEKDGIANSSQNKPKIGASLPPWAPPPLPPQDEVILNASWFVHEYKCSQELIGLYQGGEPISVAAIGIPKGLKGNFEVDSIGVYDMGTSDTRDEASIRVRLVGESVYTHVPLLAAANNGDYWLDIVDRLLIPEAFDRDIDRAFINTFKNLKKSTENVCDSTENVFNVTLM